MKFELLESDIFTLPEWGARSELSSLVFNTYKMLYRKNLNALLLMSGLSRRPLKGARRIITVKDVKYFKKQVLQVTKGRVDGDDDRKKLASFVEELLQNSNSDLLKNYERKVRDGDIFFIFDFEYTEDNPVLGKAQSICNKIYPLISTSIDI